RRRGAQPKGQSKEQGVCGRRSFQPEPKALRATGRLGSTRSAARSRARLCLPSPWAQAVGFPSAPSSRIPTILGALRRPEGEGFSPSSTRWRRIGFTVASDANDDRADGLALARARTRALYAARRVG